MSPLGLFIVYLYYKAWESAGSGSEEGDFPAERDFRGKQAEICCARPLWQPVCGRQGDVQGSVQGLIPLSRLCQSLAKQSSSATSWRPLSWTGPACTCGLSVSLGAAGRDGWASSRLSLGFFHMFNCSCRLSRSGRCAAEFFLNLSGASIPYYTPITPSQGMPYIQ